MTPFSVRLRLLAAGLAEPPAADPAVLVVLVVVLVGIVHPQELVPLVKAIMAERPRVVTLALVAVAQVLQVVLVVTVEMVGTGCSLRLMALVPIMQVAVPVATRAAAQAG